MSRPRQHPRFQRPSVELDSPLIDCRLLDLSASGLGFETSVGLRLGVPYPFRLRDGRQSLGTEAVVRWCRWIRNETVDGESRPVYRAGASFCDWQAGDCPPAPDPFEKQVDSALDDWIGSSRTGARESGEGRTVVHRAKPGRR